MSTYDTNDMGYSVAQSLKEDMQAVYTAVRSETKHSASCIGHSEALRVAAEAVGVGVDKDFTASVAEELRKSYIQGLGNDFNVYIGPFLAGVIPPLALLMVMRFAGEKIDTNSIEAAFFVFLILYPSVVSFRAWVINMLELMKVKRQGGAS